MEIISDIPQARDILRSARNAGKSVGFVPTMGYLHQGHLSLMQQARREHEFLVVSIYVNPKQFGPSEDLDTYPRDVNRDIDSAESVGVDMIFNPGDDVMYPHGYLTYVNVRELTTKLCGASRPGHFQGVTTVVAKLFNIVQPHTAYFGQKDAQQALVIKKMTRDLNLPVKITILPTVRELDGLAMSSRNTRLKPEERNQAPALHKSLNLAKSMIKARETNAATIKNAMHKLLHEHSLVLVDYLEIVDIDSLNQIDTIRDTVLVAGAIFLGETRLIDNMVIRSVDGEEVIL